MKILFFSHYFPPEGNAPASRTYENTKRWVQKGDNVTVITCAPNVPDGRVYDGYKNYLRSVDNVDGIRVVRVWSCLAPNKGTVRRILNYVSYMLSAWFCSLFEKKPDMIIATSPQFFCGWAGLLAARCYRVPFILEIRDIWPESIVAVGASLGPRTIEFLERLETIMYKAAGHIVTVGDGYRDRLIEKGVEKDRISVVMNGLNRELFYPREPDDFLKKQWGIAGKFVCCYCGTIGMACGLKIVLDAAVELKRRQIQDVVFLLVGDGAVKEQLQKEADEKELTNVVFTGRQPKHLMPEFLALSDVVLVHLKKTDLFKTVMPSKIFEAAGMAKPIINGVEGFAADFILRAGAGINIEPESESQLVDKLLDLKADNNLRVKYGESGREFVVQNFDRDKLAKDYRDSLIGFCQD